MTTSHFLAGLESGHDDEKTETRRSTLASRNDGTGEASHDADAGDGAEAACTAEGEEEITAEMIEAGVDALKSSFSLDGSMDDPEAVVSFVFQAMASASRPLKPDQ